MTDKTNQPTKKCPACQKDIPQRAKKCPYCQSDLRNWFKRHPILTVIIGLVVFFVVVGSLGSSPEEKGEKTEEKTAPAEKTAETAPPVEEILTIDSASFIQEFDKNQLAAEEKYEGKKVELTGYISNISEDIVGTPFLTIRPTAEKSYFGTNIKCSFKEKSDLTRLSNEQGVTLRGRVRTQTLGIIDIRDCEVVE